MKDDSFLVKAVALPLAALLFGFSQAIVSKSKFVRDRPNLEQFLSYLLGVLILCIGAFIAHLIYD